MQYLSYALAVLAAVANATSELLQRRANQNEANSKQMSSRLILDLLKQPIWLAGIMAVTVGFILQAIALSRSELSVVEPIIVLELPLTLIGAARFLGSRLRRREWISITIMTVGVIGLIASLAPTPAGHARISALTWILATGSTVGLIALLVLLSKRTNEAWRAALLGAATGVCFGLAASVMKGMTMQFQYGWGVLFTAWQTYLTVAVGLLGMWLLQNALNAGRLILSQPGITLFDPAISILWGVFVYHEQVRDGVFLIAAVASGVIIAWGSMRLTESPLFEEDELD